LDGFVEIVHPSRLFKQAIDSKFKNYTDTAALQK